ncbi:nucleotide-diphospho-sugar transferase [Mucilaginibacter glaciei]|uniref:Nucleotide-diphospho-sugar transferase n=1 Tax=Mucilaginibacter glaciei TaxID=2772109 RepID=A0A926NU85_9SPHI|nr:nucleotide-diphospho-sugar transferase [Mucilaginibacter glaciei]MBD1394702.1 nucleotide-diphospho-sugar transferase [Mucilaginibacter glaciei]
MSYKMPVLFLIFNRPDHTRTVFEAIRRFKPDHLFIAADGPRHDRPDDLLLCKSARAMVDHVDWDCEVKTLFRGENIGCGKAVSEAITWFFNYVDEGIVLEDDCLPNESFFNLCACLLERYRFEDQVMHIGGAYFHNQSSRIKSSYYFSNYIHIWGWATWKRAWSKYQYNIDLNQDFLNTLKIKFPDTKEYNFWKNSFSEMANHSIDTWDIQWSYSIYKNNGIGITPACNLISNIGFGAGATHTLGHDAKTAALPLGSIDTIRHLSKIRISKWTDKKTFKKLYQFGNTRFNSIKFIIGQKIPIIKVAYNKLLKAVKHFSSSQK